MSRLSGHGRAPGRDGRHRLVVVATHPVQYLSPLLRALHEHEGIDLHVLYAFLPTAAEQGQGFDRAFEWDVPVLEGYDWGQIEPIVRSPRGPHGFLALSAPAIASQLEQTRADAVLVTGWHSRVLVQAAMAARRLRVAALVRGESNDLRPRPLWVRCFHRLLFRRFDAFLAIGRANRRFYLANGVRPERIHRVPYAVENERFASASSAERAHRAELRRRWHLPEDAFVALFAGKLEPKKRPLDLLDAMTRSRHPQLHALIVGSGPLEEQMRAVVDERGLRVAFAGFLNQSEMPRAYAASDVLVLPSNHGETWGLVVNEAMASGLPAVVSDAVGCREDLVDDGATGHSFPLGDTAILSGHLDRLAADPAEARRLGGHAREKVIREYSMEVGVAGIHAALEQVGARRAPRRSR